MTASYRPNQIISSEHEEQQISLLLNGLSAMALLFLTGIGLKAWFADHHTHAIVLWLFNIPVLANMLWYLRTGNRLVSGTTCSGLDILVHSNAVRVLSC